MGPIKCEILLDRASKVYYAGETIEGKVAISLRNATRIQEMSLHLVGQAHLGTGQGESFEFYRETKSVEINKILPSGVDKFPIIWILPHDLIPSFVWKAGSVKYYFLTEIKDSKSSNGSTDQEQVLFLINNCNLYATTPVEIQNPLDLNDLPLEYQRSRGYNASYFHPTSNGNISATVAIDFVLDRQCYVPGEYLKFTCSVTYDNPTRSRKFPGVKVTLDQEESYIKDGSEKSSETKIWQKMGPSIKANDITTWADRIKIPSYCQSTPIESYGIICVQYFLHVTAATSSLWNTDEKSQFRIPLVIGKIPLNYFPHHGHPMIRASHRPSITVVHENMEHDILTNYDMNKSDRYEDDDDDEFALRPETPPPTYEEALLEELSYRNRSCSPPPYRF